MEQDYLALAKYFATELDVVEDVELPEALYNALMNSGICFIGEIAEKSEEQLAAIEGIGPEGAAELKKMLGDHGLKLQLDIGMWGPDTPHEYIAKRLQKLLT